LSNQSQLFPYFWHFLKNCCLFCGGLSFTLLNVTFLKVFEETTTNKKMKKIAIIHTYILETIEIPEDTLYLKAKVKSILDLMITLKNLSNWCQLK